jgi:hypothetical protein
VAVTPYVRIALAVTHDLDGQLIYPSASDPCSTHA